MNTKVTPVEMQQGKVYEVTIDLWYVAQIFNAGHRIRVIISSRSLFFPIFETRPPS